MFTKRNPSQARPNGRSAPAGQVHGKTPSNSGHPVKGSGRRLGAAGHVMGHDTTNMSPMAGRRGHAGRTT